MRDVVIGAGISGPAAALGLASAGHEVTVMERRSQNDLWSDSTVAITTENIASLAELGVTVPSLPPGSRSVLIDVDHHGEPVCEPQDWTTKFHIVVWGNLHEALVERTEQLGVKYDWRTSDEIPNADLVVHAQGVKYAAHHGQFRYAYRVYRGTLFEDSEPMWVTMHSADKEFVLNIGRTGTQQTWMLYLHEPAGEMTTEIITGDRRMELMARAGTMIPEPYASVITRTRTEIQSSPVGDWTMPPILTWLGKDYGDPFHIRHVDVGDAIAPLRPHTTAGANRGIDEALRLSSGYWDVWEAETRIAREHEIANGIQLGKQWMGR